MTNESTREYLATMAVIGQMLESHPDLTFSQANRLVCEAMSSPKKYGTFEALIAALNRKEKPHEKPWATKLQTISDETALFMRQMCDSQVTAFFLNDGDHIRSIILCKTSNT